MDSRLLVSTGAFDKKIRNAFLIPAFFSRIMFLHIGTIDNHLLLTKLLSSIISTLKTSGNYVIGIHKII